AAMVALDAAMVLRSRVVPAREFFLGPLTTSLGQGELLEAVEVPVPESGTGFAFLEVARVHGAFALAGVAAVLGLAADGRLARARLAACGVGGAPYSPSWLETLVVGERPGAELFAQVGERIADEVEPSGDGHAGPAYRKRVAGVLARRALALAAERCR